MAEGGSGLGLPQSGVAHGIVEEPNPTHEMELQEKPSLCLGSPEQILIQEQQCCLHQQGLLLQGSTEETVVTIFLQSRKCVQLGEKH